MGPWVIRQFAIVLSGKAQKKFHYFRVESLFEVVFELFESVEDEF